MAAEATTPFKRMGRSLPAMEMASGGLLVLAGVLIFTDRFTVFNQTFDRLGISQFGVL